MGTSVIVDIGDGGAMMIGSDVGWIAFIGHGSTVAGADDFQNCHDRERLNTSWEELIGNNLDEEAKFRTG